jgi:hypothetical protein
MGKAYEKRIRRAQEAQETVGKRPEETEPWSRDRIASFVAGFALSAAAQRQIVQAWTADQERTRDTAYDQGWESRADSEYYAQW